MSPQPPHSPWTPDDLLARLTADDIQARTVEHAPVFTVEEARAVRGELPGAHTKNLFLRNKKGRMWLVTVEADRTIDLKGLAKALGAGHFSFASAERLITWLGLTKGSVTPFGLINDTEKKVTFAIDAVLLEAEIINIHPLTNARTTAITPADLLRFCASTGHDPIRLTLS
jgi:Ala-tRNA(Pro) deacylase